MSGDHPEPRPSARPFWGERTAPLTQTQRSLRADAAPAVPAVGRPGDTLPDGRGSETPSVRALRHDRAFYRAAIDPKVGYAGYRPPGVDLAYAPRVFPKRHAAPMRRINGAASYPQTFENRHLLHDTRYPWGCVGRVSTHDGNGTGVLVGRNLVVTAAHVIPWGDHRPISFDTSHVVEPGVRANAVEVRGYETVLTGYDWAILKLDQPLGDRLGFMGFNGYSSDWEDDPVWTIVGYPEGIGPFWQQGISVDDDDEDDNGGQEFESKNADTLNGDSGAPLFAWWDHDPRIIGVVSGVASETIGGLNHIIAGGPGLGDLIAWGRSNW